MSAESDAHSSEGPVPEPTQDEPGPSVPRRSILFFLGGGKGREPPGSSATPPPAQQPTVKRKRKSGPDQGQARLKPGETGWTVEAVSDNAGQESLHEGSTMSVPLGTDGAGGRKPKAKNGDGEEAEMRDMMKRTKSTRAKGKTGQNGHAPQEDVHMAGNPVDGEARSRELV